VTENVKRVQFLYFDAGGGHRSAATALKTVIDQRGTLPWEITLVNIQEVLHSLDIFRKVTGIRLEDIYNLMLAKGLTLGAAQGLRFMHGVIRLYHGPTVRLLEKHWSETRPDLVVSLIPNFNRALFESLTKALPGIPFVTLLTDFADYPPHFWIERQRQFFICGTGKAVEQARALGHTGDRIFRASGMILRPRFYEPVNVDRAEARVKLGLDPALPTGLVLFGGQGSKVMLEIAKRLPDTQLIFICGRNESLARKLREFPQGPAAHFVEGFTSEIPYYMHLSDFFIGKPGPGSISEAVAMKLPVIVECNAWTLPQERYNAEWVRERKAGMVVANFRGIRTAVGELLASLEAYRANASRIENQAVFEIPEILARLLH
jgi:UDP-N-acetylglucosamine:LPS N-acetylglucosamine transferase